MADSQNPDRPPYKLDPWQTIRTINFGKAHNYLRISTGNAAQWRYSVIYPNTSDWHFTYMVTPRRGHPPDTSYLDTVGSVYSVISEDPYIGVNQNWTTTYDTGDTYISSISGNTVPRNGVRPIENDIFDYLERTYGVPHYGIGWETGVSRWTFGAYNAPARSVTLWNLDNLFAAYPDQDIFEWHVTIMMTFGSSDHVAYRNHEAQFVDATWWQGAHPDQFNWVYTYGTHPDYSNGAENGMFVYFPSVGAGNLGRQVFRRKSAAPLTYHPDASIGGDDITLAYNTTPHMRIQLSRSNETIRFFHNGSQEFAGNVVEQPDEAYHLINPIREHLPFYGNPNLYIPIPRPPWINSSFSHPGQ